MQFRVYQIAIDPQAGTLTAFCYTTEGARFRRTTAEWTMFDYMRLQKAMYSHLLISIWREAPVHVRDTSRFQFKRFHVARLRLLWTIADGLGIAHLWRIKPRTRADHYR